VNNKDARIAMLDAALAEVRAEVLRAIEKHAPMNSAHEGYAVILEELDELWAEVKADQGYGPSACVEALQTAAMAVRYLTDISRWPEVAS
jgi:hypothetical protein